MECLFWNYMYLPNHCWCISVHVKQAEIDRLKFNPSLWPLCKEQWLMVGYLQRTHTVSSMRNDLILIQSQTGQPKWHEPYKYMPTDADFGSAELLVGTDLCSNWMRKLLALFDLCSGFRGICSAIFTSTEESRCFLCFLSPGKKIFPLLSPVHIAWPEASWWSVKTSAHC